MRALLVASLWMAASSCLTAAGAQPLRPQRSIELVGSLPHSDQLSGLAFHRDFLIACPDEGAECYVLEKVDANRYDAIAPIVLDPDDDVELELEGAASDSKHLYLIGSHSLRRKTVDATRSYKKNRERLAVVEPHAESNRLFQLTLDRNGKLKSEKHINLTRNIAEDRFLKPFIKIPGKENGIDIEGIAVKDGRIFVGFRGPVLRGNYVPVVSLMFDEPDEYELSFVRLDGRGIRDLVSVDDGFLVLAGPVGDGDMTYRLYLWNGQDCVPRQDGENGTVRSLGELEIRENVKPEGLVVASEDVDHWELLLVCDGMKTAVSVNVPKS